MKPVTWLGDSLQRVREFSDEGKQRTGFELSEVQQGNEPTDWKPMSSIGPGVLELRIHAENEYRVIYVAKFAEAVYVLHAFAKKTQKTPTKDIELAKRRYTALLDERKSK